MGMIHLSQVRVHGCNKNSFIDISRLEGNISYNLSGFPISFCLFRDNPIYL